MAEIIPIRPGIDIKPNSPPKARKTEAKASAVAGQPKIEATKPTEAQAAAEVEATNANVRVADKADAETAQQGVKWPHLARIYLQVIAGRLVPSAVNQAKIELAEDKQTGRLKPKDLKHQEERVKTAEKSMEHRFEESRQRLEALKSPKNPPLERALGYDFSIHEYRLGIKADEQQIAELKANKVDTTLKERELKTKKDALDKLEKERKEIKINGEEIPDTLQEIAKQLSDGKLSANVDALQYIDYVALNALLYTDHNVSLKAQLKKTKAISTTEEESEYREKFKVSDVDKKTVRALMKKGSVGAGAFLLIYMHLAKKRESGQQGMAA